MFVFLSHTQTKRVSLKNMSKHMRLHTSLSDTQGLSNYFMDGYNEAYSHEGLKDTHLCFLFRKRGSSQRYFPYYLALKTFMTALLTYKGLLSYLPYLLLLLCLMWFSRIQQREWCGWVLKPSDIKLN